MCAKGVAGAAGDAEAARAREGGLVGGVSGVEAALSTALNARVRGGVAIFAYSLSLGMSLVLHWSDAVADAWLGGTELIW